jgi:hypothetical protein
MACLFMLGAGRFILLGIYVDDIVIVWNSTDETASLRRMCADLGFEHCHKERTPASTGALIDSDFAKRAAASPPTQLPPSIREPVCIATFREVLDASCTQPIAHDLTLRRRLTR